MTGGSPPRWTWPDRTRPARQSSGSPPSASSSDCPGGLRGEGSVYLVGVHDPHAERQQRDRDQLEAGQAERDADDRDAQRDAGDQVTEGKLPAEQDDPDDVADQRADAGTLTRHRRPPERPEHVVGDPEGRDPERNRDDQDAGDD